MARCSLARRLAAGGGGSTSIGYDSNGQPATVIVNAGGTVTDSHTTMGSDPTSSGTLILNGAGASWTDEVDNADPLNSRGYIIVEIQRSPHRTHQRQDSPRPDLSPPPRS